MMRSVLLNAFRDQPGQWKLIGVAALPVVRTVLGSVARLLPWLWTKVSSRAQSQPVVVFGFLLALIVAAPFAWGFVLQSAVPFLVRTALLMVAFLALSTFAASILRAVRAAPARQSAATGEGA